jgi:alkylhydroperoxidase family enzyme
VLWFSKRDSGSEIEALEVSLSRVELPRGPEIEEALNAWMPPDVPHDPLMLFRLLQHHPKLASRMRVLGAGLLAHGELPDLDREAVIARVCARCGCRYEWRVHAAIYAPEVGLTREQLQATVSGDATSLVWSSRQAALIEAVDELHDTARLSDQLWDVLRMHYDTAQLVEFLVLVGWYHTIGYVANGLLVEDEPWAAPYPDEGGF